MTIPIAERHADKIPGTLSCFDRVVITGTLPELCHTRAMAATLRAGGFRLFDYARFAESGRAGSTRGFFQRPVAGGTRPCDATISSHTPGRSTPCTILDGRVSLCLTRRWWGATIVPPMEWHDQIPARRELAVLRDASHGLPTASVDRAARIRGT